MPEAWRKRKDGVRTGRGTQQACLYLSQFTVAFFIIHANAEAALQCACVSLDCHDKLRKAHSMMLLFYSSAFTPFTVYAFNYQLPVCCTTCIITQSLVYPALNDYGISQILDALLEQCLVIRVFIEAWCWVCWDVLHNKMRYSGDMTNFWST